MKHVARILGIVGGIGAVVWAIRDRFVSVAISREPEPPAFKRPPPTTATDETMEESDDDESDPDVDPEITSVTGIGPVYATRLESAGVSTVADLSASDPEEIASVAEVSVSRAKDWIDQARDLV